MDTAGGDENLPWPTFALRGVGWGFPDPRLSSLGCTYTLPVALQLTQPTAM